MSKAKLCTLGLLLSLATQVQAVPVANWHGFYFGATAGGLRAQFDEKTILYPGSLDAARVTAINRHGNQTLNPYGLETGITAGYNWQRKNILLGLEADLQALSINDNTHTQAINVGASQYVLSAYGNNNWLFTARPRIGLITQSGFVYATGGLAVTSLQSDFLFTSALGHLESQQVYQNKIGYALGAGFETGLTNQVSMKIEYLMTDFGKTTAHIMNPHVPAGQNFSNTVNLRENMIRLGINYHLNQSSLSPQLFPLLFNANQWQVNIGVSPFFSTGNIGAPNPLLNSPDNVLASRLVYSDLTATTLESTIRLNHTSGVFVQGLLGAGNINGGQLNDEDFPAGYAYSNTYSRATGNLAYATADAGYAFFNTPTANSGLFLGYNYYVQNVNVYGCRQTAGAAVCDDPNELTHFLGISEDEQFKSMRVGLVSQMDINNRLSLTAEAAYLPLVQFTGQDNHNARQLIIPENASSGNGSMLQSVLTYQLNHYWNVGLGARYWMWNMHSGAAGFNFLADGGGTQYEPSRFNSYRYGAFIQINYQEAALDNFHFNSTPVAWRGLYVGGNLGGAWGYTEWPSVFGASPGDLGYINMPGYGGTIYSTGPIGGLDVHYYWQRNQYVFGLGGNLGLADMRGEETLFSGLGGVNGQTDVQRYFTLVGKFGVTYNRSLFYLNLGPALLNTNYHINANTHALNLGAQSQNVYWWGATIGAGMDYALTEKWTTNVEYDYIRIPKNSISFGNITTISNQSYSINQTMNIFKLGLNYKFL